MARIYRIAELRACPIETTFRIIGKRWTVLILREMFFGVTQFNRLQENVKGITPKILSRRLKELQRLRIVERRIVSQAPIRIEYRLTDVGRRLDSVLVSAAAFSMACLPRAVFKDGRSRELAAVVGGGRGP